MVPVAGAQAGLDVAGGDALEVGGEGRRRRSSSCRPAPAGRRAGSRGAAAAGGRAPGPPRPPGDWPGVMISRSWSALRAKTSSTWSSMSRCWAETQTMLSNRSGRARQKAHHRRHLDRLRPGAEDAEHPDHRTGGAASSRAASACIVTNWKPRSITRGEDLPQHLVPHALVAGVAVEHHQLARPRGGGPARPGPRLRACPGRRDTPGTESCGARRASPGWSSAGAARRPRWRGAARRRSRRRRTRSPSGRASASPGCRSRSRATRSPPACPKWRTKWP